MTAVDVFGRVDELANGTGRSLDTATGAAVGPYRKSRFMPLTRHLRALRAVTDKGVMPLTRRSQDNLYAGDTTVGRITKMVPPKK